MRNRLILGMAWSALATVALADAEKPTNNRDAVETRAIFHGIAAEYPQPQHCQFNVVWDRYPVPSSLAKKFLGSTLDADLLASSESIGVQEAIDPTGNAKDIFCQSEDYKSVVTERMAAREKDFVRRTDFTFPVFSKDFKTAILVVTHREDGGTISRPGSTERFKRMPELAIVAMILRKRGNKWRLIETETLGIT